ncbi:glycosyltransferase family 2 protein [uncultured Kordia sp.]|uniref:glycosyltransferase n=1 Tax=uncultured Kordia sp. TaxID=507699 RepID=UPI00262E403F|nr:glycosyltransferase family 2 protein [uncultured Kordia sp.]
MKFYIVIPAHNEEKHIQATLSSIVKQTKLPERLVVVNDNSSDDTEKIIDTFTDNHTFITKVNTNAPNEHLPGSKVINTFYKGFERLDDSYDVIVKLDADIILPENYLQTIANHFLNDDKVGITGGFCYIQKGDTWVLENLTDKDHVRGALKAYRKQCFIDIGGLKKAMGWDTVDELLAQYYGWKIKTDSSLQTKHLKPTGATYNKKAMYRQGEAFYRLRYGFIITLIASLKLAFLKKRVSLFYNYIKGYWLAKRKKIDFLVTPAQGDFIRKYRRDKILNKLKNLFLFR